MTRDGRDARRRFDEMFKAYKADVVGYCSWRASSAADADDAVSEVFLVAWRRLGDIPTGNAARAWLYATARRVIANQRRSRRRGERLRVRIAREPAAGDAHASDHDRVHAALALLNERDREVLLLAEWEGLTTAEIARVLGRLEVTARGRLHRARRRFHDAFTSLSPDDDESPNDPTLSLRGTRT
jgi:RNA polymerase sigma factor (sigma-70 family)